MGLQVVRLLPQNATCQTFGWEDKSVRNSQTVLATMKESGNKDQVIRLRVSGAERDMFEEKAANYGSISAMIRDAVAHYDDTLMKRRIESMNLLYPLISKQSRNLNVNSSTPVGINSLISSDSNTQIYNLMGIPVGESYRGIVVINGKKVLKK